jgi:hypothetical protein
VRGPYHVNSQWKSSKCGLISYNVGGMSIGSWSFVDLSRRGSCRRTTVTEGENVDFDE